MLDDIEYDDHAYKKHMRQASAMLAQCILRAKDGIDPNTPDELAIMRRACIPSRIWSPEDINTLIDMRRRGRTYGQIASALRRSRGAVSGALIRYDTDGRGEVGGVV